jgi:hypothetical protein
VTRGEIRTLLQSFGYDSVQALSTSAQNSAIEAAYFEILAEREWSWGQASYTGTLTAGTANYLPSADLEAVNSVFLTFGTDYLDELEEVSYEEVRRNLHEDRDTGVPRMYAQLAGSQAGTTIYLYPTPDKAYSYVILGQAGVNSTAMDADGDIPLMPERFHPMIAWLAAAQIAFRHRDWAAYQAALGKYERYMGSLKRAEAKSRPSHVVPSDVWRYVK